MGTIGRNGSGDGSVCTGGAESDERTLEGAWKGSAKVVVLMSTTFLQIYTHISISMPLGTLSSYLSPDHTNKWVLAVGQICRRWIIISPKAPTLYTPIQDASYLCTMTPSHALEAPTSSRCKRRPSAQLTKQMSDGELNPKNFLDYADVGRILEEHSISHVARRCSIPSCISLYGIVSRYGAAMA